jgi:hypothetical protein
VHGPHQLLAGELENQHSESGILFDPSLTGIANLSGGMALGAEAAEEIVISPCNQPTTESVPVWFTPGGPVTWSLW